MACMNRRARKSKRRVDKEGVLDDRIDGGGDVSRSQDRASNASEHPSCASCDPSFPVRFVDGGVSMLRAGRSRSTSGSPLSHPLFRPLLALITFMIAMQALKSAWAGKSKTQTQAPFQAAQDERLVVAHFMVGRVRAWVR